METKAVISSEDLGRAAIERRLFLFPASKHGNHESGNKKSMEQSDHARPIELPGKGRECFLSPVQGRALRFHGEKSSSPFRLRYFSPKTLHRRKHSLLPPHSSTGHANPEYSQLKLKKYGTTSNHDKSADGTGADAPANAGKKKVSCPETGRQISTARNERTGTHLGTA